MRKWRNVRRQRHSMDMVFALILFAVFAVCSALLVLLGADVYGRIAEKMNTVDTPVILSYVTEKLRSCGGADHIRIVEEEELLLSEETEDGVYITWIYVEEGYLQECYMPEGRKPIQYGGNRIAPVEAFSVKIINGDLLEIRVTDTQGSSGVRYFNISEGVPRFKRAER